MENAMQKLNRLMAEKDCRVVAGLDPVWKYVPKKAYELDENEGFILPVFRSFCIKYVKAVSKTSAAIKMNIAFFEQYGSVDFFVEIADYAQSLGLFVIADVKRADIGNTSAAYAETFLQKGTPFDAITVNPYFGTDGVLPFLQLAKENNKGIFVLVKTSNKSSSEIQDLELKDGRKVYEAVADKVNEWGQLTADDDCPDYNLVGAVVGATHPAEAAELRKRMPNTFFLVPGFGAQGASANDVAVNFDANNGGAIVNSSRGLMCAYQDKTWSALYPDPADWTVITERATERAKLMINSALHNTDKCLQ